MSQKSRACWYLPAAVVLLVATASATIIPRLSFETLTDSSELIVSGRITRSWTAWDSERKYIWTHYELATTSAYKGSPGSTVEFAEPGGQLEGQVMAVGGAVTYTPGDQVVVFLARMPNRYLRTTGWAQGKYGVDTAGRLHATLRLGDDDLVQSGAVSSAASPQSLDGMSMAELRQRIAVRLRVASQGRHQ